MSQINIDIIYRFFDRLNKILTRLMSLTLYFLMKGEYAIISPREINRVMQLSIFLFNSDGFKSSSLSSYTSKQAVYYDII